MAKEKIQYVCTACGYDSPKWIGRCPSCGEWNTFAEQRVGGKQVYDKRLQFSSGTPQSSPVKVRTIESTDEPRINLHDDELNRVLGGGLVLGSLTLLGGEPGIGKSTLILQTVLRLSNLKVLYVSGEESAHQLKLRAERLDSSNTAAEVLVACESMIENIFKHIETSNPDLVVIDSIQTIATENVESSPGSVSQIRECAAMLLKFAKESPTLLSSSSDILPRTALLPVRRFWNTWSIPSSSSKATSTICTALSEPSRTASALLLN